MVGFGGLRDLNDGRFSVSVVFFFFITRCQRQLVLFRYEISMTVGFGGLRDLNEGLICWVMRFQ